MFESVLGETGGTIAQFILALIVVLLLIVLIAWLVKRFGMGRFGAAHGPQAELEVITSIAVDQKRKLVLVRHGKLEHLLLIGGGSDEVIERSMIGGIPISARVQAGKAQETPASEKLQPTPGELSSKRFADAVARNKTGASPSSEPPAGDAAAGKSAANPEKPRGALNKTLAASAGLAAGGLAATAANISSKAKAATSGIAPGKTKSADAPTLSATTPTDAPSRIKSETAEPVLTLPAKTSADTKLETSASQPFQDERDALDQSLDEALSESLLGTPAGQRAAASTDQSAGPSTGASTEISGGTSGRTSAGPSDLDLERELEAALDFGDMSLDDDIDVQGTDMADMPPLPDLSGLTDDPAPSEPPKPVPSNPIAPDPKALDPLSMESVRAQREPEKTPDLTAPPQEATAPKPSDIPVELSGRTQPPIPVAIPSRGPAANATTLAKSDADESAGDAKPEPDASIDISSKLATSEIPASQTAHEAGQKTSDDLDDEMRRLLGELSSDPKRN